MSSIKNKRALIFSLLASVVIPWLTVSILRAEEPLSNIVEGIRDRYGDLPGFCANYDREILSKTRAMLGEPVKSDLAAGTICFKPPHFLRIEQQAPGPETVITDGTELWWYIPQKNQAYHYPADRLGEELKILLDIFHGLKKAEESFEISRIKQEEDGPVHRIMLKPKPPWPQVDYINLAVGRENHDIKVVEIHNYVGGVTRFILGETRERRDFPEGFFLFELPEGVKVIEGEKEG